MALTNSNDYIKLPSYGQIHSLTPVTLGYIQNGYLLNAAGEYGGITLQVPPGRGGTITKIHLNCKTVPTAGDLKVSVQSVDSNGYPAGDWSTDTNATVAAAAAAGWQVGTLTAGAVVAAGDVISIVAEVPAGSSFAGWLTRLSNSFSNYVGGFPFGVFNDGSDKKASSMLGICAELSDGSILAFNQFAPISHSAPTANVSTTGDGWGMKFTIPFKCRAVGIGGSILALNNGDSVFFRLAVDGNSVNDLGNLTLTADQTAGATGYSHMVQGFFSAAVALDAGDVIYLIAEMAAGIIATYKHETDGGTGEAKFLDAVTDGTPVTIAAGTITEESRNHFYQVYIIIDQVDDGTGGGGGTPGVPTAVAVL